MAETSEAIYRNGNLNSDIVGYAMFDNGELVGLISKYDPRDTGLNGLSSADELFGRIGAAIQPSQLLGYASVTATRSPTNSLMYQNQVEFDRAYKDNFVDLLSNLGEEIMIEAIQTIASTFAPWYLNTLVAVLDGENIPTIVTTLPGLNFFENLVGFSDFSPEQTTNFELRDTSTQPLFSSQDFQAANDQTVFVTYDSTQSNSEINWAFSPEISSQVFSDASSASNAHLSVTPRDQTLQAGESIAASSLFPSYLWVDGDGSYDITAFAIQDRTVGGGYLEVAGVPVPEATVFEFAISDLPNWRFVAASDSFVDEIGFNIIQENGDFSTRLTPGARVTTSPAEDPPPPPQTNYPDTIDIDNGNEGDTPLEEDFAEFYAYRDGDLEGDVVLSWSVSGIGSNPASPTDFLQTTGTVTIRNEHDSARITVQFTDDALFEADERFKIDFDIVSGNAVFSDDDESATIVNDDAPLPWENGSDDHGNSLASATFVEEDQWAQGLIEAPGDVDWFRFDLKGGARYDILVQGDNDTSQLDGNGDNNAPGLDDSTAFLYRADGSLLAEVPTREGGFIPAYEWNEYELDLFGQADQTVYLSVRENGDNDVGQYFVQADVRVKADDFAADTGTTGRLSLDDPLLASHERALDSDWFSVDLEAGGTYRFAAFNDNRLELSQSQLDGSNGLYYFGWNDPRLSVHDQFGMELVATDPDSYPASSNLLEFTASSGGKYFFAVDAFDAFGDIPQYYALVQQVPDAPNAIPVVLQPGPSEGQDVTFSNIRSPNQVGVDDQWLRANGNTSSALQFDLTNMPTVSTYAAIELFLADTTSGSGQTADVVLDIPLNNWDETASLSTLGGIDFFSAIPQPQLGEWVTVDVTSLYNQWQSGELENTGIVLSPSESSSGPTNLFYSSDFLDNPLLRPKLIVYGEAAEAQVTGNFVAQLTEDEGEITGNISIIGFGSQLPTFANAHTSGVMGDLEVNTEGTQWTYTLDGNAQSLSSGETFTETLFLTATNGLVQPVEVIVDGVNDSTILVGPTEYDLGPAADQISGSLLFLDVDSSDINPLLVAGVSTSVTGRLVTHQSGEWDYEVLPGTRPNQGTTIDQHVVTTNDGSDFNLFFSISAASPVAVDDVAETNEDVAVSGNVLTNDTGVHGNTLNVTTGVVASIQGGSATLLANGDYNYTPAAGFFGTDSFDYTVNDGNGGSDTGTVNITVNEVITPPNPVEVIVDNQDGSQTLSTGSWTTSSGTGPHAGNSVFANANGESFTWNPDLGAVGGYEISTWWTYWNNRDTTVTYEVHHTGGVTDIELNQRDQTLDSQWNSLGSYTLDQSSFVRVVHDGGSTTTTSADALRFSPAAPPVPIEVIVDNQDEAQTSMTGSWTSSSGTGPHAGNSVFANANGESFTWNPDLSADSEYEITAWWTYWSNRDTSVTYEVHHVNGVTNIEFNQRDQALDSQWNSLGSYTLDQSSFVRVVHDGGSATTTSADALRFSPAAPPVPIEIIVDNQDEAQTSMTGSWTSSSGTGPHAGNSVFANANGESFTWNPDLSADSEYEITAWWTYWSNRDTSVTYEVHHVNGVTNIEFNQRDQALDSQWNSLGSYTLDQSSFVRVVHDGGTSTTTSADALRFSPVVESTALAAIEEAEENIINVNIGDNVLYGTSGVDRFAFEAASAFDNIDTIADFSVTEGDRLDISDLLVGYDPSSNAIEAFVQITDNGTDSYVAVDSVGSTENYVQIVTLVGVTELGNEDALELSGHLITV